MRCFSRFCVGAVICVSAPYVTADDQADETAEPPALNEEFRCFSSTGIVNFMKRFDGLDEDKTDTIHAVFAANISVTDDGVLPDKVYIKSDTQETNLAFDEDGLIQDFEPSIKAAQEGSEICIQDTARAGTPVEQGRAVFNLPLSVRFKNMSGRYDIAELQDGLKDGKSFYKKMVGGAAALLVPKMTHMVISYDEEDALLNLAVFKGNEQIGTPEVEPFSGSHVIRFKDLKKAGATHIEISGGDHRLSPTPSVKIMEKYGFGGG